MIDDKGLQEIAQELADQGIAVRSHHIREVLKDKLDLDMEDSTIRGRFIQMGRPLSGFVKKIPVIAEKPIVVNVKEEIIPSVGNGDLNGFVPNGAEIKNYIERPIDERLAAHYRLNKYPLTQGKQGTGKTMSHMYYAYKQQLPFVLISCYQDLSLKNYFGSKSIRNGSCCLYA
jgi:hypothetical protein